ncbi:MAG: hypothetical protein ACE14P_11875 [Methanotrichaceae archaeon]
MRRSIEIGVLLVSVLLTLSIFVAFAENQTISKDNNATKINATNGTANVTAAENITASSNMTVENMTANNTASNNSIDPFAKVKGVLPKGTSDGTND